jgi:hypothetical protein
MQNLITQLMQPKLGEDKPSTIQRRAAEALATTLNMSQADKAARIACEEDNRNLLTLLTNAEFKLEVIDHQSAYREVMNNDYLANFT